MEFKDIFSVDRKEYVAFLEQIKSENKRIEEVELNKWTTVVKTFSTKTNKCLCSRVSYKERTEGEERQPERYYIFEMPDDDERAPAIPKYQLKLETPQQVQAFVDLIAKLRKEKEND